MNDNDQVIAYLIDFGYQEKEYIKILNSRTLKEYNRETLLTKIKSINDNLLNYGYPKQKIIKMTSDLPSLYSNSTTKLETTRQTLIDFGWNKESIIAKTISNPALYTYKPTSMQQRLIDIQELGFTEEESKKITQKYPMAFGGSLEAISQKIKYLQEIGLREVVVKDSERLRQSIEVTYARHQYLTKEENEKITMNNYGLIFLNEKYFQKRYGTDKALLLKRYKYSDYLESKNARTI